MKDRDCWPRVNMREIDPDWWETVMAATSQPQHDCLFDQRLSDEDDFTIRVIVFLMESETVTKEHLEWYFEGSLHGERLVQVKELLTGSVDQRLEGKNELERIVKEYTDQVLD